MITRVVFAALLFAGCAAREAKPVASPTMTTTTTTTTSSPAPYPPYMRDGMRVRPLNGVAVQFATYLNGMHRRIHPEFTDKELVRLDGLPTNDPSNDKKLKTRLELVLSASDGRIVRVTVGESSGVAAFDAAAFESVQRAAPFEVPPAEIVSADGNVHVDWQLSRDETFACSTMHTRPFLLARD